MLYCHPDHWGQGLAARLIAACEEAGLARGPASLHNEASAMARPAFTRAGWTLLRRRDFTILHQGRRVPIHNYAMEKRL